MSPDELEQKVESLLQGHVRLSMKVLLLSSEVEALTEELEQAVKLAGLDVPAFRRRLAKRKAAAARRRVLPPKSDQDN